MATYASKLRQENGQSKAKLNKDGNVVIETSAGAESTEILGDDAVVSSNIKNNVGASGTSRGLSPTLWSECPIADYMVNPENGSYMFDDFADGGIVVTNNVATGAASATGTVGRWTACTAATGATIISTLATDHKGVVKLESTTDNEDAIIAYPKTAHTAGTYKFTSGKQLWMEARVKILNTTTNKFNAFFGFAEEGLVATTTLITASDAMADKDYVGFQKTFVSTTGISSVYNTTSGATSPATVAAAAATVVADTFTKIGMYCDGTTVYFYQNGTKGDGIALATADFPDGEEMAFYVGLMLGHGDTASISVDWVAIAQEY